MHLFMHYFNLCSIILSFIIIFSHVISLFFFILNLCMIILLLYDHDLDLSLFMYYHSFFPKKKMSRGAPLRLRISKFIHHFLFQKKIKQCIILAQESSGTRVFMEFAEYSLFYRALLQKRPIIVRSLLIVATPYSDFHGIRDFHELTDPYDRYFFDFEKKVQTQMMMQRK